MKTKVFQNFLNEDLRKDLLMSEYDLFDGELCEFSSLMIQHKIQVLEVANNTKFLDGNISRVGYDANHIALRATAKGLPEYTTYTLDGITYKAIKVAEKIYVQTRICFKNLYKIGFKRTRKLNVQIYLRFFS